MMRVALFALLAIALIPISSAFAEGQIELNSDQDSIMATDSILVYGKVTGVTDFVPVKLSVIAPDGEEVFAPEIQFDDSGEFKRLIHPPLPSFKLGTYTIIASHDKLTESATRISPERTGLVIPSNKARFTIAYSISTVCPDDEMSCANCISNWPA